MWKRADANDLPEYDREVIVLYQPHIDDDYHVGFGHRPNPDGYDTKSILTGKKVGHYTPMTYNKGGWNSPNIVWWLDLDLPSSNEN